ncbi:MAG: rhomboid family intramembrane serine protease [Chitinophagaceae bacterium]
MDLSITLIIVIITSLVSIGGFNNQKIIDDLIFYPPAVKRGQWYRLVTHGLIHADGFHLIFNMIALYSFGEAVEKALFSYSCFFGTNGKWIFLLLYITGLIVASIPDLVKHRDSYHFRSLGASGAVSAVVFSSILLLPKLGVGLAFIPGIQIPGYIFAVLYLIISAYLDKKGGGKVNHGAHLWGAVYGLLFTYIAVNFFTDINIIENFKEQLQAPKPFLPSCAVAE